MIGSLRGRLSELEPGEQTAECVIDVSGVGYRVTVGSRLAASIGALGSEVALAVHTHVREGAITLYGFSDAAERRTFEMLIGTHGVGPALAVAILSVHRPDELAAVVAEEDVDGLCRVPGVGKKTAQRLLVELGPRLEQLGPLSASGPVRGRELASAGPRGEVAEVLTTLGYARDEVREAFAALEAAGECPEDSVEELLRAALRELAPRR